MLSVRVSPQGSADTVTIHSSSGHGTLDKAAMKAVRRWRFIPAQRNGQAVAMTVQVPVTFSWNSFSSSKLGPWFSDRGVMA